MAASISTHRRIKLLTLFAALAALATRVDAQSYSIDWFKIAGGGGTSTGGVYSASGTIGQHDAGGPMAGGSYAVTGGFWSLVSAVQTPGAPFLSIQLTGTNTVVVSWPSSATGFFLQRNSNVGTTNWVSVTNSVSLIGGSSQVIISPPAGNQFYRLKYPSAG